MINKSILLKDLLNVKTTFKIRSIVEMANWFVFGAQGKSKTFTESQEKLKRGKE